MADQAADDEVRAAGAVLWRPAGGGAQVALVHRPKYDDWSFPKGKLDPGEHVLLAAVREVAEETGRRVTLGRRLPPVRYATNGSRKRVDYWAATVTSPASSFVPNSEIDGIAWVAASKAAARLSYQRDVETLAAFRAGPLRTVPLILLRHASAGRKADWRRDDRLRPLDDRGTKDAATLADLLCCFGSARVISSPSERCVATVRPYAARAGVEIETEPALEVLKDGAADDPEAAKTVAQLAAADEPVIICAHRENLAVLLAAACAELGAECQSVDPLRKGEFLVLHRIDRKLAAVERYGVGGAMPP
jgi:8-oxo-dGTP pyrophosphatase MutT (NUDIX family)/phosphohistidine phosphatase SixA